jgi:O-antigen/teichoic acid export membrane protein
LKSVATLTSGTVIAQIITIVASPVITRLYSPADMGMFASYTAITAILGVIAAGSYELAIVLPENENDAYAIVFLGGIISVIFGVIVTIFFALFGVSLSYVLKLQAIPHRWLYYIGFIITLIGVDNVLNKLMIRKGSFKILASTQIMQQSGTNGIKIVSGFFGMGTEGLFLATIIGYLIREFRMFLSEKSRFLIREKIPKFIKIIEIAKRYKKFPLVNNWSSIFNSASTQVPVIMITSMFSTDVTGYYSLSHRILSLPMIFIGQSVAQVFLDRAAKARNTPDELARITISIYKKLLLIGSITMSFATFYGDLLFPFVFGSAWAMAGRYAQWLSIWLVFVLSASPLSSLYSILERQGEGLVTNIIIFVSRIGIIVIALVLGFSDIELIAAFSIIGSVLWIGMCFRVLRLVRISVGEIIGSSFFIAGTVFALQFIISVFMRKFLWGL